MSDGSKSPQQSSGLRSLRLTDALLNRIDPAFSAWHTAEPKLLFAGRQFCEDPKTGIAQFGPAALDGSPRTAIRAGVIGTGETIQLLKNWASRARTPIRAGLNSKGRPYDPLLAPCFPGFDIESPFQCSVEFDDRLQVTLTQREIADIVNQPDFTHRVKYAIELITPRLCALADKEPSPDVVVLAMPKEIEESIGPEGRAGQPRQPSLTPMQKKERRKIQADRERGQMLFDFDEEPTESFLATHLFRDFHNSLKAHAMKAKLATQLLWHSTLTGSRKTEDPATTAWNFFTALYYKAGNVPWELQFTSPRTCFVGITFYRESSEPDALTRTCLAQAFSETGEGVVLRGERVTWDKERDRKPHLNREDSESLLRRVLELYRDHTAGRQPPTRVVIHKTSRFWPEELAGFHAAIDDIHSYDFLAIERRGIRFMRLGKEPPVRGTVIQLGPKNYLVYTQGYVPFLRQYPGPRIPNPLEIIEHHGDSAAERVCSEVLSLTKLNWNTCKFASAEPITIAFSKQVSKIIKELPEGVEPSTKYRHYM